MRESTFAKRSHKMFCEMNSTRCRAKRNTLKHLKLFHLKAKDRTLLPGNQGRTPFLQSLPENGHVTLENLGKSRELSKTLSSEVNVPHTIDFRTLRGANLVTYPQGFWWIGIFESYRVYLTICFLKLFCKSHLPSPSTHFLYQ